MTMLASKLSHAKRRKILLAPEQARQGINSVALEDSLGGKLSNELPTLDASPFVRKKIRCASLPANHHQNVRQLT
jgi:hypothetical protein